ncbi:hypothetical protein R1T08_07160 [Streptomyces sp. SBC-4]|nr:hypothetical protein [Streptomyces sp. SBC-4]MDV5144046.1 hypothetical protein [Streptomyces sp. SBC-4]
MLRGCGDKLARDVCHGKRGTIHQVYRDGREGQFGSRGLVLNVLGGYSFTASTPAGGGLRPLRDPDAFELDEDGEECST